MKLNERQRYNWMKLRVIGWTGPHEGYDYLCYFNLDTGMYFGPDKFGVEPLFEEMNETRCEECGCPVEDDMCICYVCAQRNDEAEYEANEIRSAGRTEDQ